MADAAVDGVVLVPPLEFLLEGERTGSCRIGDTGLLADVDGNSRISYADFATAVLVEAGQADVTGRRYPLMQCFEDHARGGGTSTCPR